MNFSKIRRKKSFWYFLIGVSAARRDSNPWYNFKVVRRFSHASWRDWFQRFKLWQGGPDLKCGEGGIRTLGTTLRSYDGLVTPHAVIDFSVLNYGKVMSRCWLFSSHLLIPLLLIFFSRIIASDRVSQFIKPVNVHGIPCLLLNVEPELWLFRRIWRLLVCPQ